MAQPASNNALSRANAAANTNQGGNRVGGTKQPCPVYDVIIIVAGTVDPVNHEKGKLASSFENTPHGKGRRPVPAVPPKLPSKYDKASHDPNKPEESQQDSDYYWAGNAKFVGKLLGFQDSHDHVMVFRDHSWSGDNCIKNRKLAGRIFIDWLSGRGLPCALPAYKNRKVSFHFIGHSHGGNVINEMSLRIANSGAWPADWKVKSVVYLSTPFFQTIHKPTTAKWHGGARICNVFCKYDLTQTAIADFSLRQLTRVTNVVVSTMDSEERDLAKALDRIVQFDVKCLGALARAPRPGWKWDWLNTGVEWTWTLDPTEARNMYDRVLALIKDIQIVFAEAILIVQDLGEPVPTRISETFKKFEFDDKRRILQPGIRDRVIAELKLVIAGTKPAERAFRARIASGVYPGKGFFEDINTESLLLPLISLLSIDPDSLNGKLSNFLYDMFKDLIEVFDDTLHTCNHLYKIPIVTVDVSKHDKYYQKRDKQFDEFKGELIKAEVKYMGSQGRYDFLHMLFLLAGQLEVAHKVIKYAKIGAEAANVILYARHPIDMWRGKISFYARMKDLIGLIRDWYKVLDSRYCGGIEWAVTKEEHSRDVREAAEEIAAQAIIDKRDKRDRPKPSAEEQKKQLDAILRTPVYGGVPYLAVVSHSVSRKELYPAVDTFLRAQFDSHVVPAKR